MAGLRRIDEIDPRRFDLVSTDVFDTLLLRDFSLEWRRFHEASAIASNALRRQGIDVDPKTLAAAREAVHVAAYRALSVERPHSDVNLTDMLALQARMLGLPLHAINELREAELIVERRRLTPNRDLISTLNQLVSAGKRVVAVSDTYYSEPDLERLVREIVGAAPMHRIYSSSDMKTTKNKGDLFRAVAESEGVDLSRVFHFGDHPDADVARPRAANCIAVHLPRPAWVRVGRRLGAALLPAAWTHMVQS